MNVYIFFINRRGPRGRRVGGKGEIHRCWKDCYDRYLLHKLYAIVFSGCDRSFPDIFVNFNLRLRVFYPLAGSEKFAGMGCDFGCCCEGVCKVILQNVVAESTVKDVAGP